MAKRTSSTRKRATRRPSPPRRATVRKPLKATKPKKKVTARPAAKKAKPARKATKATRRPAPAKATKAAAVKRPKPAQKAKTAKAPVKAAKAPAHAPHPATINRQRRQLPDSERATATPPVDDRLVAEARSGHDAAVRSRRQHTETSPELTAGDVDAKWDDAYSVGDEAPGGDNPTPDQNDVEAIGRALGAEYDDDEELMGGDEIGERDAHRWELDPNSKDDDDE